jgi:type VI secretion system secreted protein VgrG
MPSAHHDIMLRTRILAFMPLFSRSSYRGKDTRMKNIGSSRASPRRTRYFWLSAIPVVVGAVAAATFVFSQSAVAAAVAVPLGTAGSYAILAGTPDITNTGPSVISGDVGISPAASVTGFPPGIVDNGTINAANAAAADAQADLTNAYNYAAGEVKTASIPAFIGGGQTLGPGVYNATSALGVGGMLTLNGEGETDPVFIFQVGSQLTVATGTTIVLANGASACNVYWQVGSTAVLDSGTSFVGTILALTSITVGSGDNIAGRALARNGDVTLIDDTISLPSCAPAPPTSPPTSASPTPTHTSPSPTPTHTSPSPTPTHTSPSPTPTHTSPSPTRSRPAPSPTGTSPSPTRSRTAPSPTGTSPSPSPIGTLLAPSPTGTGPSPTPSGTLLAPSPTSTSPSPSPTATKPKAKPKPKTKPKPAPIPKPVGTTFPVTG